MHRFLGESPKAFGDRLVRLGVRRALFVRRDGVLQARPEALQPLADEVSKHADMRDHEALLLEAPRGLPGALFCAAIHSSVRGQTLGGVRRWVYLSLADVLRDGLRLAQGMTRKNALARLWWGGGKGVIAGVEPDPEPAVRERVYAAWGGFTSSLRGVYITGEDVGTSPADMAVVARHTRFVSCAPEAMGGSGNPAHFTAAGVVAAMEAAFESLGRPGLAGVRVAMQGAGNVGAAMLEGLLAGGVASIVVSELSGARRQELEDRFAERPVRVVPSRSAADGIFDEPCDVFVPNALGGVLGPKTIPRLRAKLVCGAANNPLEDEARDAAALAERGILYVPDFLANRMGVVHCSNEPYGSLPRDPVIVHHLERGPGSIHGDTRLVLETAARDQILPLEAAHRLAAERAQMPHPLVPGRGQAILDALWHERWWERGR